MPRSVDSNNNVDVTISGGNDKPTYQDNRNKKGPKEPNPRYSDSEKLSKLYEYAYWGYNIPGIEPEFVEYRMEFKQIEELILRVARSYVPEFDTVTVVDSPIYDDKHGKKLSKHPIAYRLDAYITLPSNASCLRTKEDPDAIIRIRQDSFSPELISFMKNYGYYDKPKLEERGRSRNNRGIRAIRLAVENFLLEEFDHNGADFRRRFGDNPNKRKLHSRIALIVDRDDPNRYQLMMSPDQLMKNLGIERAIESSRIPDYDKDDIEDLVRRNIMKEMRNSKSHFGLVRASKVLDDPEDPKYQNRYVIIRKVINVTKNKKHRYIPEVKSANVGSGKSRM